MAAQRRGDSGCQSLTTASLDRDLTCSTGFKKETVHGAPQNPTAAAGVPASVSDSGRAAAPPEQASPAQQRTEPQTSLPAPTGSAASLSGSDAGQDGRRFLGLRHNPGAPLGEHRTTVALTEKLLQWVQNRHISEIFMIPLNSFSKKIVGGECLL